MVDDGDRWPCWGLHKYVYIYHMVWCGDGLLLLISLPPYYFLPLVLMQQEGM